MRIALPNRQPIWRAYTSALFSGLTNAATTATNGGGNPPPPPSADHRTRARYGHDRLPPPPPARAPFSFSLRRRRRALLDPLVSRSETPRSRHLLPDATDFDATIRRHLASRRRTALVSPGNSRRRQVTHTHTQAGNNVPSFAFRRRHYVCGTFHSSSITIGSTTLLVKVRGCVYRASR